MSTTFIAIVFSLLAGYAISKYRFKGKDSFSFLILATQMLPAPLLLIPMYIIFNKVGIIDTLFGLIVANVAFSIPLCVWMLRGFFDTMPDELEDAAIVDGCTRMGAFYRIYLPLIIPGLVATSIFAFLIAWGEFFASYTLINTEANWVAAVGISTFMGEYVVSWDQIMAASTIFTIPAILFFIFIQRYLVAGLTAGSVKG
jgi:multiple sugar transport system permease protein